MGGNQRNIDDYLPVLMADVSSDEELPELRRIHNPIPTFLPRGHTHEDIDKMFHFMREAGEAVQP